MTRTYGQVCLGVDSEQLLLERVLSNSGFEYSPARTMRGLSGLDHHIDAVGVRGNNMAIVLSGPKDLGLRHKDDIGFLSPKFESEIWCRDALLRMYDISALLEREGLKVDLVLFENRFNPIIPHFNKFENISQWLYDNNFPQDTTGRWLRSRNDIALPGVRFLSDTGKSAGACYFGLNDFSIHEISAFFGTDADEATRQIRAAMSRVRLDQYFNPPTDELILTALALSNRHDPAIIEEVYGAAVSFEHTPVANVIVPEIDYKDPVATAIQLKKMGTIEYSAEIRLNENGREIVHHVKKTAQENFVIRLIKYLDAPRIVEAFLKSIKSG